MRSHCAVYVDAGYLLAAAATKLTGTSFRSGIAVEHETLLRRLADQAEQRSGLPLLRIYWYDAARDRRPDATQDRIAMLPRVKVRLGRMSGGEQKGVDLRIGLDMVTHARNGAVEVMYLLSGDDDLTEAVDEAQTHGVQVVILAVPTSCGAPQSVSVNLQRAADGLELVTPADIEDAIKPTAAGIAATIAAASTAKPPASVVKPSMPASLPEPAAATTPAIPARPVPLPGPPARPVYSSNTGGAATIAAEFQRTDEESAELLANVASRVLTAWLASATESDQEALLTRKPSIPSEVDRTLLRDASSALEIYDLPDPIRYELRAQFWGAVDSTTFGTAVSDQNGGGSSF